MSVHIAVIIPARNEAGNIETLVAELRRTPAHTIIVVDNGSTDSTAAEALVAGAMVVSEPRPGYGHACAAGTRAATDVGADIVVFIDGDHSCRPDEMMRLVQPILDDEADMVLGSRALGTIAGDSMHPHQRVGNKVLAGLVRVLYRISVTDLGPYRAIRLAHLNELDMKEMTFGWPTEMTVKMAKRRHRIVEAPITWQVRQEGESKVSGTVRGSLLAGYHMMHVTLRHARGSSVAERNGLDRRGEFVENVHDRVDADARARGHVDMAVD